MNISVLCSAKVCCIQIGMQGAGAAKREAGESPARSRRCKRRVLSRSMHRSLKRSFGKTDKTGYLDEEIMPLRKSEDLHNNHDHASG